MRPLIDVAVLRRAARNVEQVGNGAMILEAEYIGLAADEIVALRQDNMQLVAFIRRDGCATCAHRDSDHTKPPCTDCVGLDHWTVPLAH